MLQSLMLLLLLLLLLRLEVMISRQLPMGSRGRQSFQQGKSRMRE